MMSTEMEMVKQQMLAGGHAFKAAFDVQAQREASKLSAAMPPVPGVRFEEAEYGGCYTDVVIPEWSRQDALIVYIHGGGFVSGDPRYFRSFTSYLAVQANMTVYGTVYRLAPEDPFPAGAEDSYAAYRAIAEANPGKKIFLLGESGGATMVTVVGLMAKDRGFHLPDAIVAYAPMCDLSGAVDRTPYAQTDIVVGQGALDTLISMYAPNQEDRMHPYCSLIYGDYTGFPPYRLVWDAGEQFCADAHAMIPKLTRAGVTLETKEWSGTYHTFEMLTFTPEAQEEIADSIRFMVQYL